VFFFIVLGVVTFLPSLLVADTIVLKDGRRIEAEQVWLEKEMVRYKKFDTVVGLPTRQVARVITDASTSAGPVVDFGEGDGHENMRFLLKTPF
jgi:hypothetical protein